MGPSDNAGWYIPLHGIHLQDIHCLNNLLQNNLHPGIRLQDTFLRSILLRDTHLRDTHPPDTLLQDTPPLLSLIHI